MLVVVTCQYDCDIGVLLVKMEFQISALKPLKRSYRSACGIRVFASLEFPHWWSDHRITAFIPHVLVE